MKEKESFRINPGSPAAIASMLAFALSIPLYTAGYADRLHEPVIAFALVFLYALSAALFIVVILKFGRKALRLSILPVFIGLLNLVFKLILDPRGAGALHHSSAIALYLSVFVLWTLTVLYVIRTKWVLALLFLVPFVKHVFADDLPVLLGTAEPVSVSTWLKEISMLLLMLAYFFCAVSFERTVPKRGQENAGCDR